MPICLHWMYIQHRNEFCKPWKETNYLHFLNCTFFSILVFRSMRALLWHTRVVQPLMKLNKVNAFMTWAEISARSCLSILSGTNKIHMCKVDHMGFFDVLQYNRIKHHQSAVKSRKQNVMLTGWCLDHLKYPENGWCLYSVASAYWLYWLPQTSF